MKNHITRVYVLPNYQKKGFGTFIIKNMEDQIAKNYDKVYLGVSLPAAALYEKLGFSTMKHEKYPVENEVVLVYEIMGKNLGVSIIMLEKSVFDERKPVFEKKNRCLMGKK